VGSAARRAATAAAALAAEAESVRTAARNNKRVAHPKKNIQALSPPGLGPKPMEHAIHVRKKKLLPCSRLKIIDCSASGGQQEKWPGELLQGFWRPGEFLKGFLFLGRGCTGMLLSDSF